MKKPLVNAINEIRVLDGEDRRQPPFMGKRYQYDPQDTFPSMSKNTISAVERIREKLAKGEYQFEHCDCYCGSNNDVLLAEIDYCNLFYPFVLCKNCGLMRANPRLTEKSYIDFYAYDYGALYGEDDHDKEELFHTHEKEGQRIFDFVQNFVDLPVNATVVDVGCNMGAMLSPFAKKGYAVMGVGYGVEYIEFGRNKTGFNLQVGGIEKILDSGEKADLIILNHVFEHFLDLGKELQGIRQIMKPGGYIYLFVPGTFWWLQNKCGSNFKSLLEIDHTWQFSLESLTYVLNSSGFELVTGNEQVTAIFRDSPNPVYSKRNVSADEAERVLKYLKRQELRYLIRKPIIRLLEAVGIRNVLKRIIKGSNSP